MSGKAACVFLTETMYEILRSLSNRRMLPQSILLRIKVILLAQEKKSNTEISEIVGLERHAVGLWRRRWRDSLEALMAMQFQEPHAQFTRSLILVVSDAPRSGSIGHFTAEQFVQIVATACEPPSDCDRPVTTWTGRELADEVKQRGIVDSISAAQVNRYLRQVELQPQRNKYWCFTTEKDPKLFAQQVETVCQTYLQATDCYLHNKTRTVCMDEMTSLQANQRRALGMPPMPGEVGKIECQYTRHGTLSLTGSWDVFLGQMLNTTIAETRNACDFAIHVERTVQTDQNAKWVFIVDNLNTHYGEPIVRTIAKLLEIDENKLGEKKKCGVLKSMASRREFLSDQSHSVRFVYLPKHSSWLNQIEVIFGIISRRVIRSGSFRSTDELKEKLLAFIDYFNRTFAKTMTWTYTGRPIQNNQKYRPRTWRENRETAKTTQKLALVA